MDSQPNMAVDKRWNRKWKGSSILECSRLHLMDIDINHCQARFRESKTYKHVAYWQLKWKIWPIDWWVKPTGRWLGRWTRNHRWYPPPTCWMGYQEACRISPGGGWSHLPPTTRRWTIICIEWHRRFLIWLMQRAPYELWTSMNQLAIKRSTS